MLDLNAQKCMIFSTAGFQSGALQYAAAKKICCVTLVDGRSLMLTKSMSAPRVEYSSPKSFAGILLEAGESSTVTCFTFDSQDIRPLADWISQS